MFLITKSAELELNVVGSASMSMYSKLKSLFFPFPLYGVFASAVRTAKLVGIGFPAAKIGAVVARPIIVLPINVKSPFTFNFPPTAPGILVTKLTSP